MPVEPWGIYPPEINAGRMETGVGFPTWIAAALEWTAQAGIVAETTAVFAGQTAIITGNWGGVGSNQFATVAAPFSAWLAKMQTMSIVNATACWEAVGAYFTARATMVPLAVIIANRVAARTAQAACLLGAPNTEAVRLEAEYAAYWAHNGSVMTGYDIAANSATAFKPVPPPPPLASTTSVGGNIGDAAARAAEGGRGAGESSGGKGSGAGSSSGSGTSGQGSAAQSNVSQLAQIPQQMMSQSMGMGQQVLNPVAYPPSYGDSSMWGGLMGGGAMGSFGSAGSAGSAGGGGSAGSAGGGSAGSAGGGGGSTGVAGAAAPLAEMARPTPVAPVSPTGFNGVPNSPTTGRPPMPMVPPMHPAGAGRKGEAGAASSIPVIRAAEPLFPVTVIPVEETEETVNAVQPKISAV